MNNEIIDEIVKTAHNIYDKDLNIAKSGNISVIDDDREYIYITCSGSSFKHLEYNDIIMVKIDDLSYDKKCDKVPSMETNLHINVYRKRCDVNSVIHVHSPYATAFAFSDRKLIRQEGFGEITSEYIKEVDYFTPGSEKLAEHVSKALVDDDAVLMKDHGVTCVGKDISEATLLCEYIEAIAKTQYITHVLSL